MGLTKMTEIQYRTFEELGLLGKDHADGTNVDILGRARTGTGKTIAFLLPALHHLESCGAQNLKGISVLIISPTRELATQIAQQATELIQYSKKDYAVQVMYGGTKKPADLNKISRRMPTILVTTPGRLKDHLQSSSLPDKMGTFKSLFRHTKVSVLDEADCLLEMGFRKDIMAILGYLPPKEKRQTFLFSATLPEQLQEVMAKAMKPNYKTVNCINDGSAETSLQVAQSHVILPSMNRVVISVYEVLKQAQKDPDYKVIVFFPVARLVAYFEELLSDALGMDNVWGIHSRKTQGARNRVSEEFRKTKSGILLSSDVSARGVDYPDVTHVIQCGLPDSKEQYIHRLGRTGRGGKEGKGWLVLAPFEASFVKQDLRDVDCPRDEALDAMFSERPEQEHLDFIFPGLKKVQGTSDLRKTARLAYSAWLGYYLGNTKRLGMRKEDMVGCANDFAKYAGLAEQPTLTPNLARKMGLAGVNGIILAQDTDDDKPRRGGGGRGGGGGGGNRNGASRGGGRGDNRSPSRDDRRRR
jgi:ATP-dependent RNA helicase MSS116